jgi:hypothetical protein
MSFRAFHWQWLGEIGNNPVGQRDLHDEITPICFTLINPVDVMVFMVAHGTKRPAVTFADISKGQGTV